MGDRIDLIAGVVLCALGILGVAVLIPTGIQEPQSVDFAALSPSYWPRIVCIALAAMGLAIAVATFFTDDQAEAGDESESSEYSLPVIALRVALAVALMFIGYILLEPLGFVVTSALAMLVFMAYAGERNLMVMLLLSAGVPLFLFFFFTKVASIPIPNGVLNSILGGG